MYDEPSSNELHLAVRSNKPIALHQRIMSGVAVNQTDEFGNSPLLLCSQRSSRHRLGMMLQLLQAGADATIKNENGESPLDLAQKCGCDVASEMLRSWLSNPPHWSPSDMATNDHLREHPDVQWIHKGGMTKLYKVTTSTKIHVVMKHFNFTVANDDEVMKTELDNIDALMSMKHRNICQLLGKSEIDMDSSCRIAMEFVDGKTLAAVIKEVKLRNCQVQNYCRQILHALSYLHNHQPPLIHRDINTRNIMINGADVVKLIDFGLSAVVQSKLAHKSYQSVNLVGTYSCMAPELLRPDDPDGYIQYSTKSDIWAFGCVGFEMVTGEAAFKARNHHGYERRICDENPPELTADDGELKDFLRISWHKQPNWRPSAVELLQHNFLKDRIVLEYDNSDVVVQATHRLLRLLHETKHSVLTDWNNKLCATLSALKDFASKIDISHRQENSAKTGTAATGVVGGIVAIVGAALLIPSFGAALPLLITGSAVAVSSGIGNVTANVAGRLVKSKEFKRANEQFSCYRQESDDLLLHCCQEFVSSLVALVNQLERSHNQQLPICPIRTGAVLLQFSKELKKIEADVNKVETEMAAPHDDKKTEQQAQQRTSPLMEKLAELIAGVDNVVHRLTTAAQTSRFDSSASARAEEFHQSLTCVMKFIVQLFSILIYGTTERDSSLLETALLSSRAGARAAAGAAHVVYEAAAGAARSVAPRVVGIVGAAVFSVVDVGLTVYYAKQLYDIDHKGLKHGLSKEIDVMMAAIENQQQLVTGLANTPSC